MRPHFTLLALCLFNAVPSDANLFARSTESLARTANRWHHRAAKRSAGLAKDLRRAFSGMYYQQELASTGGSQRVYCVNNASGLTPASNSSGSSGSGSSSANGTSSNSSAGSTASGSAHASSSGTAKASSTASSPSSTSSPSSKWKLVQSYVRVLSSAACA